MRIAIVDAGTAGLTAAHELIMRGHAVTVYEAAPHAGGLPSGFRDERWEWPLERCYHHLFTTDTAIRALAEDIGFGDNLFFRRQVTAQMSSSYMDASIADRTSLSLRGLISNLSMGYDGHIAPRPPRSTTVRGTVARLLLLNGPS